MKILPAQKKILICIIIFAMALSAFFYFHHKHSKAVTPEIFIVEAQKVKAGNIPIQAQAIGTLTAEKSVELTPEIPGHVAEILFQDGAFVKQGTPLIQLDDKVFKAKLESAKANLFYSETNYKRMMLLGKRGAVSQQAIDQALADLKEKKAAAEESQVAFEKMLLRAPFDGRMGKAMISPGNYVSVGQVLATIVDIQHLRVEYSISEQFLPKLKLNQIVKITSSTFPGKEFSGKVSYISPTINSEDRTITLYASVPNDDAVLTAGLFVSISHFFGMEHNALLIPAQSLTATIDGQTVYKVSDGKVSSISVELGQRTTDTVEVKKGLTQNDVVVIAGQQKLKDGSHVEIKKVN